MIMFVDTSVFLAVLNREDPNNLAASERLADLVENGEELFCTNFILVEAYALLQNRLGMNAVRDFQKTILPSIKIIWLGEEEHSRVVEKFISENRRSVSFVDQSSFDAMRRKGIDTVFTFDKHFREQGFTVIP
jgi:predicted nucleic acid-binding protein